MPRITIADATTGRYWNAFITESQAKRWDNGMMVSIGLRVPEDISPRVLAMIPGKHEISFEEWNHSSCQSECKLRGGKTCRW